MKILIDNKLIEITPEILAELFTELDSDQQAVFFNHIDAVASKWQSPFCFQLQSITDSDCLTLQGRRVMQGIGDYSHFGLVSKIVLELEMRNERFE